MPHNSMTCGCNVDYDGQRCAFHTIGRGLVLSPTVADSLHNVGAWYWIDPNGVMRPIGAGTDAS